MGAAATMIDSDKNYCINMTIDYSIMNKLNIDLAPKIDADGMATVLGANPYIKEHLITSSKVVLSKYSGTIKMNLCKKCQNGKIMKILKDKNKV